MGSSAYLGGWFPPGNQFGRNQAGKGICLVSWDHLRQAIILDSQYVDLLHRVGTGSGSWSEAKKAYER